MPGIVETLLAEVRYHPSNPPEEWLLRALGVPEGVAGVDVNEDTALKHSAVWACVRVLSETIASVPLQVFTRSGDTVSPDRDHPLYHLLHDAPNPHQTSFRFREMLMGHLALWGNAYIEIERDRAGRPVALWPLLPDRTEPKRKSGTKYLVTRPDFGREYVLQPGRFIHICGLGFDGLKGYSPIAYARMSLGLAMAADEYGGRFFGKGMQPSGYLTTQNRFRKPEDLEAVREQFEEVHGGLKNSHRMLILQQGLEWKPISIPPNDAQFLETRGFGVLDVSRWYGVPPHLLAHLSDATFSNVEHEGTRFVTHTIRPWAVRWEQELAKELFPGSNKRSFAEFSLDGLLRGDMTTRFEAYSKARMMGVYSANEVRRLENMNPLADGGDIYMVPANMMAVERLSDPPPAPIAPPAGDDDDDDDRSAPASPSEIRAMAGRRRTIASFEPLIRQAAVRIMNREIPVVRRMARANLRTASVFEGEVGAWYQGHRDYVQRQMEPVLQAMASEIVPQAIDEANRGGEYEPAPFVRSYAATFAERHATRAQNQLSNLLTRTEPDEQLVAIEERLTEWEERSPDKISAEESVKAGSAIARAAWMAVGVLILVWRANSNACPICMRMNGKTVSIHSSFLVAGDEIDPNVAGMAKMIIKRSFGHPPLHGECECGISPG